MNDMMLLLPILLPVAGAVAVLLLGHASHALRIGLTVLTTAACAAVAVVLFTQGNSAQGITLELPWAPLINFDLRLYSFSAWILVAAAAFSFLVALYSWHYMAGRPHGVQFCLYLLLTLAMVSGAVLANHLVVLLFFWEGLLLTLLGMIAIGRPGAWKTAFKAFIIVGVSDICMTGGIVITGLLAHTLKISDIHLATSGLGGLAMLLLIIGATAKAGSMPFHSWIPDAAVDAPLPFMALLPASIEKLLGIYFLSRISLDMFHMSLSSWLSTTMMVAGAATIVLAVAMALVQKNYKRLLSYHAISQVGYMVLGVGTGVPAGIVGGLFHMINNALYKSCLFMTAGAVEKQTGTADLNQLGGLGRKMPLTFLCFIVAAASISGFPLTNGFYSKELLYDGALQRGTIFYLAALVGTFLTSASFLKLGHAAFLGKRDSRHDAIREVPGTMLIPMGVIAATCLLFGVGNAIPVGKLIQPALGAAGGEHSLATVLPHNWMLAGLAAGAVLLAILNHLWGWRRYGSGLHAVDHIHHAPVFSFIYAGAEKRWFDPYDLARSVVIVVASIGWGLDRAVNWLTDGLPVGLAQMGGYLLTAAHRGRYALYVVWCLLGAVAIIGFLIKTM
jgi:formate hydrogenlyase subunit 3/multisubunit Na+/H+ antiporter MnhD subunit